MGTLYVVATPIGNLNDISKRALETLNNVDYILCEDTRVSIKLLNHFDIKKKLISYHKFNEKERLGSVINDLKEGKNIALISDAGTPCISDPGYILIEQVKKEQIEVIGIGGISALTTAISVSGIDATNFSFYGFFPRDNKEKEELLLNLRKSPIKVHIFYESPKRIIKTLEYLYQNLNDIEISLSKNLTKKQEKTYYGMIKDIIEVLKNDEKASFGEYTIIIKKEIVEETKEEISTEAKLVAILIKENFTMKEAIELLHKKEKNIPKSDIYKASLNIKDKIRV